MTSSEKKKKAVDCKVSPHQPLIVRSHMDVQASDGRSMLLRYVATYLPKFSDAFATEWLNDHASDFAIARRVLTEYRPLEPEMVLQLASFLFRPCRAPGSVKRFVPPNFLQGPPNAMTQAYMESEWRSEDMCLLEFMRKVRSCHHSQMPRHKGKKADG